MQNVSNQVSESVDIVSDATNKVGEYITTIVAAIEEQTAVTNEISQSMQHIASSVNALDECIKLF